MPHSILGIDAAWTPTNPTGVALITGRPGAWRCIAAAPSYARFLSLSPGALASFDTTSPVAAVDASALISHALTLAGGTPVQLVAVDMPLATQPITARRACDDAVSHAFGKYQCSTHSPTPARPGAIATNLRDQFVRLQFPLRTAAEPSATLPALIEVYPHPALVTLLSETKRLPYKVSRARRYWRGATRDERDANLIKTWARITRALADKLGELPLPPIATVPHARWKAYEDALDAIVCAWIGTTYIDGNARAYGDPTAAIWCPLA